jgi:uncharacterized protein (DUF1501 family)
LETAGDRVRRRDVLRFLAALGAVGLSPAGLALAKRSAKGGEADREAKHSGKGGEQANAPWRSGKQLVVVLLQGGPDSLSMVAPTGDPLYACLRPTTALAPGCGGLDLGEGFTLHPALLALTTHYTQKRLAIVPACAMPGVLPNHPEAMNAFAHGASQSKSSGNGWLGRLALALGGGSAQMVVASQSDIYSGAPHYNMYAPSHGPSLPGLPVEDQALFETASKLFAGQGPLEKTFASGRKTRQETLSKLLEESRRASLGALPAPAFPEFGERLGHELAKRRDAALAFLAVGGFDTHSAQGGVKGYLADRLHEMALGLAGLASGLGKTLEDTVIVALGEFGRSARENAFGGTDNGLGGVMLVLGGPVAGGRLYGDWPGLASHRLIGGRDLPVATDWRDVVARIAMRHLGLPEKRVGDVFPGFIPSTAPPAVVA